MLATLVRAEVIPAAVVLAALLASFACVVAERGAQRRPITGRSNCACGRALRARQLIPIVSWLVSRGRASCCAAPIPARYIRAETIAALLGGGVGLLVREYTRDGFVLWPLLGLVLGLAAIFLAVVRASSPPIWHQLDERDPARR